MQATRSIPASAQAPRASEYWLLVPVALVAAAAALWPASPDSDEVVAAPQPVVSATTAWSVPVGDSPVPDASRVQFKDDAAEEPAPTF